MTSDRSKEQFAGRVKRLMAAKGMEVADLAAKGQLNTSAIYPWLAAKFMPRGENLRKLAQALDASTDYLLGGAVDYEGFDDRQIAVHESFSVYLKSKGITPSHPEYEMYDRLKGTAKPPIPTTVEEWKHLTTTMIPIIQEYSGKRKKSESRRDKHQGESSPKRGSVVQLRRAKSRPTD